VFGNIFILWILIAGKRKILNLFLIYCAVLSDLKVS